ncbi:helix-turn-helix domain-containing protein [Dactylosporangium roseum]|uniref:Helix-turn-helix domain-containing protein n=1 Tax=Dactylosporangium roseum TaxID=47989 RepID=A0ABY5Z0V5_9ACTN|nr:helix-turn-helix transcriptional regulator [Dactylosporangium roseum]UWZ35664.1 helix-turn-helix domain-containing protein [Dactylosporangium roseum]
MASGAQAGNGTLGSPNIFRRLLGEQLRNLRERNGRSCEAVGRYLQSSGSKISRIESGHVKIKESDLGALLHLYGVVEPTEQRAFLEVVSLANDSPWWREFGDVVADWFDPYLALESAAQTIRTYEIRFIPGLLQTPEYAQEVIGLRYPRSEVARRVELRLHRQRMLLERRSTVLWAVIDEMALRQQIGAPQVMQQQIAALVKATEAPNITIQVLPSREGLRAETGNSFSIFRSGPKRVPDVVYLEHLDHAEYFSDSSTTDPYKVHMNAIGVAAKRPAQTVAVLEQIARGDELS